MLSALLLIACVEPTPTSLDSGAPSADDGDPVVLDDVLGALRADPTAAMLDRSRANGWPAPVEGGWLFVHAMGPNFELAGEHSEWAPEAMNQEAGFAWLVRAGDSGGGYKFTDGDEWIADPWARAYGYDEFGELSVIPGAPGAHLERQFEVQGQGLEARTLRLWVPDGEHTHTLYMMDGQNLFDPAAPHGGWQLQDAIPAGVLVVGIDNTGARMEEYTPVEDVISGERYGGAGAAYGTFVQQDIRPLINGIYGAEGRVGLLGSSLGGLISYAIAAQYPDEYAFSGSMSGTMGWGSIGASNPTMIDVYAAMAHRSTALFLDSGGEGSCADTDGDGIEDDAPDGADNYCENLQLRDVLAGAGFRYDVDLWHWWEPGAEHNEAAWADRVHRPLSIFAAL